MPVTDGLLNPIFIQEASVAYVPVTLQLADFYVPFVRHTDLSSPQFCFSLGSLNSNSSESRPVPLCDTGLRVRTLLGAMKLDEPPSGSFPAPALRSPIARAVLGQEPI